MNTSTTSRKYIFIILFTGILLGLFCVIFHPFEPRYHRKKLTAWAREVYLPYLANEQRNFSRAERAENDVAVAVIRQIGTNVLPEALNLCRAKDSKLRIRLEDWTKYDSGGVIKYTLPTADQKRNDGGNIIWALGPMAEPAIPSLLQLLQSQDRDLAESAFYALPGIGTNVIPPLMELLNGTNKDFRLRAARVLGSFGRKTDASVSAPIIVPALVHCIQTETNQIYFWALGCFGTNAEAAVPVLTNILGSFKPPYYPPKPAAFGALNQIDPQAAKPFVAEWQANLTDSSLKQLRNPSSIRTNSPSP